jgi:uncharacterized protein (DUF2225 family)
MSGLADVKLLGWILDKLMSYSDKNKERASEAISAIHAAWTKTYDYLKNQEGDYVPNQELSDLWNEAAHYTRLVDKELASQLQDKSRFWIHPDLPRQRRILLLTEIIDELERLNKKF